MSIKSQGGIFGRNPTFNDVEVDGTLTVGGNSVPDASTILVDGDIGSTVQGYDADTAKLDVAQTWTATQSFAADALIRKTGKADGIGYELVGRAADGYSRFQAYDRSGTVGTGSLSFFEDGSIGFNRSNTGTLVENAKFTTSGNLAFPSGQGIDFSATAGTGTSELFDDYEEGVYDATITTSTSGSVSLLAGQNSLQYTKIGRKVFVSGGLWVDTVSSPVGYFSISLPFVTASLSEAQGYFTGSVYVQGASSANMADFVVFGVPGQSSVRVYLGDATGFQADSAEQIGSSSEIYVSLCYIAA